jgi:ribosome-associated protein
MIEYTQAAGPPENQPIVAKKIQISSEEKAQLLVDAVEDRKAEEVRVIDLRDKDVMLADYILICTGTSTTHIRAIAERVIERVEDLNLPKPGIEGEAVAEWVLLDFGDVILHVMNEESRERYKLEQFWTTPQPKGALPPRPGPDAVETSTLESGARWDDDRADPEAPGEDAEFDDDAAFFEDADTEVEPIDDEADGAQRA